MRKKTRHTPNAYCISFVSLTGRVRLRPVLKNALFGKRTVTTEDDRWGTRGEFQVLGGVRGGGPGRAFREGFIVFLEELCLRKQLTPWIW